MKTELQISRKLDEIREAINPNHPLSADTMMKSLATQALEWVLDERDSIYGEKEKEEV